MWKQTALKMKIDGNSWTQIYSEFPDIQRDTIRKWVTRQDEYQKTKGIKKEVIGVMGDLHIPFEHPNYIYFLKDTFKKFKVTRTISIGDLLDHYSYSRFTKKPIAMTARQEKELAIQKLEPYKKAFPKLEICLGNHDTRLIERVEEFGIDDEIIKDFKDIYKMPKKWTIYDEYENLLMIDDVLYIHGSAYNGQNGAKQAALNEQMSVVMGHGHSFAGVFPVANKRKLMFGMNVGCGVDIKAYAFAYNKKNKFRPLIGCGIVYSSNYAIWVPMGKEYFRD